MKVPQPHPKVQQASSKVQEASPRLQQASTKVHEGSNKVQEASSKVQQASHQVQQASDEVEPSSKVQEASSKLQTPPPKHKPAPPAFSDDDEAEDDLYEPSVEVGQPSHSTEEDLEEIPDEELAALEEEEVDELSDGFEVEGTSFSNPKGRTPKVEVQFPCSQCMLAGKKCELHVSKKSMKCLRCFTKGYGPCRVTKEPIQKLPSPASTKVPAKKASETFFKVGPRLKQASEPQTMVEVVIPQLPAANKHKRAKLADREDSDSELEILPPQPEKLQAKPDVQPEGHSEVYSEVQPEVQEALWQAYGRLHQVHSFISDPQLRQTLLYLDTELEQALNLLGPSV